MNNGNAINWSQSLCESSYLDSIALKKIINISIFPDQPVSA